MKAVISDIFFRRNPNQLALLDGVRALAIIFVIFFHGFFFIQYLFAEKDQYYSFLEQLPWCVRWILNGDLGVDLFFVLSAFLLSTELLRQHQSDGQINWRWFYTKRVLRIYPLYGFALLLYSVLGSSNHEYFWANLLALNNVLDVEHIFIPWSWSLTVELQFYFICPWLLTLLIRSNRPMLFISLLTLLSLLWQTFFIAKLINVTLIDLFNNKELRVYYFQYLYVPLQSRLPAFLFGVFGAWLLIYRKPILKKFFKNKYMANIISLSSLTVFLLFISYNRYFPNQFLGGDIGYIFYNFYTLIGRPVVALSVASIIILVFLNVPGIRWVNQLLCNSIFYPIAKTSYSMYLFHPLFIVLSYHIFLGENKIASVSWFNLLLITAFGFALSFIFGVLCYIAVENWFIKGKIKNYLKERLCGADTQFGDLAIHRGDLSRRDETAPATGLR